MAMAALISAIDWPALESLELLGLAAAGGADAHGAADFIHHVSLLACCIHDRGSLAADPLSAAAKCGALVQRPSAGSARRLSREAGPAIATAPCIFTLGELTCPCAFQRDRFAAEVEQNTVGICAQLRLTGVRGAFWGCCPAASGRWSQTRSQCIM